MPSVAGPIRTLSLILFSATIVFHFWGGENIAFLLACLTLGGFAALIGSSIENIGLHYSLALTGTLQTTLGSIPLVVVIILMLSQGKAETAQMIIVGAILSNGLLVLGLTYLSGSLAKGKIVFNKELSGESSVLFIMAVMALAFAGAANSGNKYPPETLYIISVILLLTYAIWMHQHIKSSPVVREDRPKETAVLRTSIWTIALASLGSALVAWWLTHDIDSVAETFSLSPLFVGAIVLPLAASAAGNTSSIFLARYGHPRLAVALVQGSLAQITAFLFPALVLFSFFLDTRLTLAAPSLFITALGISGLVIRQISNDGEASLFEGAALVGSFFILATLAYFTSI